MCGIAGIIGPETESIAKMTAMLAHRGPDSDGIFESKNIALGHRRLAIIDLSENGRQPMFSDDGRFVIVFNGEIYNHLELRAGLNNRRPFFSESDTETILRCFEEIGEAIFRKLNGIFTFALHDILTGEVWIVRDHFGIKPLYFLAENDRFIFASELKALLETGISNREIDHEAVANYIHFLWSPGERTPFSAVKKLLPGHFLKLKTDNPGDVSTIKFYEIPLNGSYSNKTENELTDELEHLLKQAVRRQLLSDVPVGFFLSGGLDSSLIVALARQILPNEKLRCYTIDTGESNDGFASDLPFARLAARHLNVDLCEIKARPDMIADFDLMVWHLDEPQADLAPLNVKLIAEQARADGRIVLLGGTAGDDLFSGYRRHQMLNWHGWLKVASLFSPVFRLIGNRSALGRRLNKAVQNAGLPLDEYLAGLYGWLPEGQLLVLFSPEIRAFLKKKPRPVQILLDSLTQISLEKQPLNKMLWWDQKFYNPDHNLQYTDKMSMIHGIETRVPFLDLDLVDFAARLPVGLKMKGGTTKYLLKKVAERYLPNELIYRPKTGFGVPLREWMRGELQLMLADRLSPENLRRRGIFDPEAVQKLISDNHAGRVDASYSLLALLTLESWMRQFFDRESQ